MKSYRKELWFNVPTRRAFVNITPDVQKCIDESGVKEGLVLCNAKHIQLQKYPIENSMPFFLFGPFKKHFQKMIAAN